MLPKMNLTPKTKKILNIVVDVVAGVILAFALLLAVCSISSKAKGYGQYTEIFGKAYLAVQSDSMKGDGKDNFSKGDMITIKTLSMEEARKLSVGDIITFQYVITDTDGNVLNILNSHRIIRIEGEEGMATAYFTHGDNNVQGANERVLVSEVIGVYKGKAGGIGKMLLFMSSSAGFFVCVVLPTLIVVAYCAVNLVLVIKKEKKTQAVAEEQEKLEERERMRQELLAEMQQSQAAPVQPVEPAADNATEEKPAEETSSEKPSTDENK